MGGPQGADTYSTICRTMSTLYGHTFKANHLDWKLGMSCCKFQWFKSHLLFGLVRLGSEIRLILFKATPKFRKGFGFLPATITDPNRAKRVDNTEFSEITNEAKFIL